MDLELKGKVVFITGGSRGIGKGIARTMAREGCNIAITATRADLLETTATEIKEEFGVEVAWFVGDLLRTDDAESIMQEPRQEGYSKHYPIKHGRRDWV